MGMKVLPAYGEPIGIAIIDPNKQYGEEGQYVSHSLPLCDARKYAATARQEGKEIRWYYRSIVADGDEPVASQVIVTEIPPGHIQPFHSHNTLHEMTLVMSGMIVAVDDPELDESAGIEALLERAERKETIAQGQMVIEGPGTNHTILNLTGSYATLVTIQTARIPLTEFPHDWVRDKLEEEA